MPKERKIVDKFKVIESLGILQKAVEDDLIEKGTISFSRQDSGVYQVTIIYDLIEIKHETKKS